MVLNNQPYYDKYSEVYLRPKRYFDLLAHVLVDSTSDQLPTSVLDIGCGFGDFLVALKTHLKKSAHFCGLTIALHEYKHIKKKLPWIDIILGKQQDLDTLYNHKDVFDLVINFHTLSYSHQHEQLSTVKTMVAHTRPNGRIVLGLFDDWVGINSHIKQQGKGFLQFWYSPSLFLVLADTMILEHSWKDMFDGYRIQIWKKSKPSIFSRFIGLWLFSWYIFRNNLVHWYVISNIIRYYRVNNLKGR